MKISVAICTYNGEKYIKEQIESILNQSRQVDEIVICDDCSSDNTYELCQEMLNSFRGQFSIYKNEERKGVTDNFSKAFDLCTGDIIFSCDQDDVWKTDKVQHTIEWMSKENAVLAFSDADLVDEERRTIGTLWNAVGLTYDQVNNPSGYMHRLFRAFMVTGATMAFQKELWDLCKPVSKPCLHDEWLSLMAPFYGKCVAIPEKLIEYRRHKGNVTQVGNAIDRRKNTCADRFQTEYDELLAVYKRIPNSRNVYGKTLERALAYHLGIKNLRKKQKKISKLITLSILFYTGLYREFRGGWKLFLLDIGYVLSHE